MNTAETLYLPSMSSEQTEKIASSIGSRLRGGEVIELRSDLGGGKTTFTRGLVRGTGSTDRVASPTFTISREYMAPKFTIVHFDFYRLSEAGIVADELNELIEDQGYVKVVEWGEIVDDVLPADRLSVGFKQTGDDTRGLSFTYPKSLEYLVESFT